MDNLKGKVVVVTGGNSGIGYATAKAFVAAGAKVIVTGRRKAAIDAAAAQIGAIPFVADQGNLQDVDRLRMDVENQFGKVDVLFINAGITGTANLIENSGVENFDSVMDVNFKGAYFTLSKFIPILNNGASVVMLSSIVAATHVPYHSVYQASKAALNSIAKTAAAELATRGIRVNIVSPGPHKTEVMKKAGLDAATLENIDARTIERVPLKKIGEPDDVAQLVLYLCGESANFITGTEIIVDGGMTL